MDAIDHGKAVLSAILRGRKDLLERAQMRIHVGHFQDPQQKAMWRMLEMYADYTGTVLSYEALGGVLKHETSGTVLLYQEYFVALLKLADEPDGLFWWHVDELRDLSASRQTGEAIARGIEILRRGVTEDGETVHGHAEARASMIEAFSDIDRDYQLQESPEGDVRAERDDILADYAARAMAVSQGRGLVSTGLPRIDRLLGGGLQNGECDLLAAYTSVGKTSFLVQLAWYNAVKQGKNVVFFTSETLRSQIRLKLVARHSLETKRFREKYPNGLDSSLIKSGHLTADQLEYFTGTVEHLTRTPEHGIIWLAQIPRGATMDVVDAKLHRLSSRFEADLCIVDYFQLLRAERKRQSQREELSDIMKSGKQMAAGYRNGRGVPVITPWQINRAGFEKAQTRQYYEMSDLAETHEAAATSDVIISLFDTEKGTGKRNTRLAAQLLKSRDSDTGRGWVTELDVDYATCLFREADGTYGADVPEEPAFSTAYAS